MIIKGITDLKKGVIKMKKIVGIFLGIFTLIGTGNAETTVPPYYANMLKNLGNLTEAEKGIKGIFHVFERQLVASEQTVFSRAAQIEKWAATNLKAPEAAALSWPEKAFLFSDTERILSQQQIKDILSEEEILSRVQGTKALDEFYLIAFPEQVLEHKFLPSEKQVRDAISYYRTRLIKLSEEPPSARKWGKSMAIITDLGLFGSAQDAQAIIRTATQFHNELAGMSDLIATRALMSVNSYDSVEALAKLRLLERTPEGKSVKLAAQWKQIKEYMDQINVALDIDVERRVAAEPVVLPNTTNRLLQQYNPYNLLQEDAQQATTDFWLDVRQGVDALISSARTGRQLTEKLQASVSLLQAFNQITLEDLQNFINTNQRKPRVTFGPGSRDESTLATRVQNILNNYPVNSPEVQAINQIYRDLEQEQAMLQEDMETLERNILSELETPEQILDRLRAFRETHHKNPHRKLKADLPNLSQQDLEEHWLAVRTNEILNDSDPHNVVIRSIKIMWKKGFQQPKPKPIPEIQTEPSFAFSKLTRDLSDFIEENFRRPRGHIRRSINNLSVLEKEEKKLEQKITTALREGDPANPGYQTLLELWESAPGTAKPNSELVKQKVERFIQENDGQWPRLEIYRNGRLIQPRNYTLEEAKEANLAQMMSRLWKSARKGDPFSQWLIETRRWPSYE